MPKALSSSSRSAVRTSYASRRPVLPPDRVHDAGLRHRLRVPDRAHLPADRQASSNRRPCASFRRYAIVGIAVIVAVATPCGDPISMLPSPSRWSCSTRSPSSSVALERRRRAAVPPERPTDVTVRRSLAGYAVPARPVPDPRRSTPSTRPVGAGGRPTGSGKTVVAEYAVDWRWPRAARPSTRRRSRRSRTRSTATGCAGTAPIGSAC